MNSTLNRLLPTTLPTDRSACPDQAAWTLTANSGELVPKATTVKPITNGDTPTVAASREAPRTSHSAPTTRAVNPSRNRISVKVFMDSRLLQPSATRGTRRCGRGESSTRNE
jgi:hypothetical protein